MIRATLEQTLKSRFAKIIEADVDTSGFWQDVADFYGVEVLTEKQQKLAIKIAHQMAIKVRR